MRLFFVSLLVLLVSLLACTSTAHAQAKVSVNQITSAWPDFINKQVVVEGVPSNFRKSEPQLRAYWKSMYDLTDQQGGKIVVYTNDPEPAEGQVLKVTGTVRHDGNPAPASSIHLEQLSGGVNPWLIGLLCALAVAVIAFVYLLVRKPSSPQVTSGLAVASPAAVGPTVSPVRSSSASGAPEVACVNAACGKLITATDEYCEFCGSSQRKPQVVVAPTPLPASVGTSNALSASSNSSSSTRADLPSARPTTLENLIGNLYVKDGSQKGKFYPLGGHAVVLGRDRTCTIILDGDNISREHAEVRLEGDVVVIEDKNSTNGTFVNGQRITRHELADKDEVRIGSTTLVYEKR